MLLRDDSDSSWKKYGSKDPYYGVLSDEMYRKQNLNQASLEEFFESGQSHINHVLSVVEEHFGNKLMAAALDFGCGVGRLVLPLSRIYTKVSGVDVAPSMIEEAHKNCQAFDVNNVNFFRSDDQLSEVNGEYDLVHSVIVLQHIPRRRGEKIIRRLMQLTKPAGGILVIHVNLTRNASVIRKVINYGRRNFWPLDWFVNFTQGKSINEPFMQMNSYNLTRIILDAYQYGFEQFFMERFHNDEYPGILLYAKRGATQSD